MGGGELINITPRGKKKNRLYKARGGGERSDRVGESQIEDRVGKGREWRDVRRVSTGARRRAAGRGGERGRGSR